MAQHDEQLDPIEDEEIPFLNQMLAAIHRQAQNGDPEAIDRAVKIIQLKRAIRQDRKAQKAL